VKSVELFTGAGGLAIATAKAGFHHLALVERDKHSCHTIRENQQRGVSVVGVQVSLEQKTGLSLEVLLHKALIEGCSSLMHEIVE
jgi:site-specific DNA-cytosine methylase